MKIPLSKPFLKKDIILKQIEHVLDFKWISGGPTVDLFENEIKKYNDDPDGNYIAVSNGTVALELSLLYLNNGQTYHNTDKREVIVPSWSWVATGFSVLRVGAKPVWCDVNKFGVVSAEDIEKLITERTAAIMIVHQLGIPCDLDSINQLSIKYNIPIIEDGACAFGSEYKSKKIGNSRNIVTYSFQAKKPLTTGEGGMIVVRSKEAAEWIKSYRSFGTNMTPYNRQKNSTYVKEYFDKIGGNYKMSDINAAVGLAHLQYIDEEIENRKIASEYYNEKIKNLNIRGHSIAHANIIPDYCTRYNWQTYHVLLSSKYPRDAILELMHNRGINCKWDIASTHLQPVINDRDIILNNTRLFDRQGIQLPFYAEITREEQDYVIKNLEEVLNEVSIH